VLKYLCDMRDATRMALAYALVDARLSGRIPSPIRLRRKLKPWFVSSMPYARHHINPACSKAVALLRAYRKRHERLALPSLEKLSMRIDGELFKMTKHDDSQVTVRITIRPHEYEYVRFRPSHKKWSAYSLGRLGEITLTDSRLLLTFVEGLASKPLGDTLVGVDMNFATIDCTPVDRGRLGHPSTIPTGSIEHIQDSFSRRRRRLQLHVKNPQKRAPRSWRRREGGRGSASTTLSTS
jgi:putative transposase